MSKHHQPSPPSSSTSSPLKSLSAPETLRPRPWSTHIPSLTSESFQLSDDPTKPSHVALRTYALALSLSLGPALVPFVTKLVKNASAGRSNGKTWGNLDVVKLKRVLRRELGYDGFAFSVTLAVAGGAFVKNLWKGWKEDLDGRPSSASNNSTYEAALKQILLSWISKLKTLLASLTPEQETFLAHAISASLGVVLLQAGTNREARLRALRASATTTASTANIRKQLRDATSPTLDLTLLLLVRAVDSVVQGVIMRRSTPGPSSGATQGSDVNSHEFGEKGIVPQVVVDKLEKEKARRDKEVRQRWTSQVDAFVFWVCSARIMWCFFYQPQRLPQSYVTWIKTLANLDGRLITALQYIRQGTWSYIRGPASPLHASLLQDAAKDLGFPSSWGNPSILPAFGGLAANEVWKTLGVQSRRSVGGLPCELLHTPVGKSFGLEMSCTANASLRMVKGFLDAAAIYIPVHFFPLILTRPRALLRPHRFLSTLLSALRSATFLSSFIGLYWYSVCLTRTLVLARLFPFISHDWWDGPFGCVMAGCLTCGGSIWLEEGRRRGEMALYVLPRAIRAFLPDAWVKSGRRGVKIVEQLAFILSLATLLTAASHRPDSLRGLSRWTLAFVTNGPNAGFWKRRRRDPSVPPTPSVPATPSDS
ncbi:hypothetical protein CPB83DRAFT_896125 [Crepidotus variabilis]|uniref:Transmembrane protein 135 n=1 Tax=Crepidotus variabilis TaxID=179855 RepID=A0A9P6JML9_9AGAR|nr:hypothetical protein CPB83DRAFT_896125 [Crepidotus variabilis]